MRSTLAIAALTALLPSALARCCPPYDYGVCKDKTQGTPCCGFGPCNIFCCNCSTSCRGGNGPLLSGDRSADTGVEGHVSATTEAFLLADTGSKGYLTLDDYLKYMKVEENHQMWVDWFKRHDQDGDGKLTVEEVHSKKEDAV